MSKGHATSSIPIPVIKTMCKLCWIAAVLLLLGAAISHFGYQSQITELNKVTGWPHHVADVVVNNRTAALFHGGVLALLLAAFIKMVERRIKTRRHGAGIPAYWAWILVAVVAGDGYLLSRHYVQTMPSDFVAENDVVRVLKSEMKDQRVGMVVQSGFYNQWLTYLFPYHGIQTFNAAQLPRMAAAYRNFLGAVGQDPMRLWRMGAVGIIMGPAQMVGQLRQEPNFDDKYQLIYAYNTQGKPNGGVDVISASQQSPGQHALIKLKMPSPRFSLVTTWETAEDEQALRLLGNPQYPLFQKLLVPPEFADRCPPSSNKNPQGSIQVLSYRPGRMVLKVSSSSTGILRVADKYDPDWRATVGGEPVPVIRCDYLFTGIPIQAGVTEVMLEYKPENGILISQLLAMVACVIAAGLVIRSGRKPVSS